jgi:hypothetical protein
MEFKLISRVSRRAQSIALPGNIAVVTLPNLALFPMVVGFAHVRQILQGVSRLQRLL